MSKVRHIKVIEDDDGQRLDRWIKKRVPEIPYGLAQKLMRQGQIRVDSKRAKPDTRLKAGQDVRIPPVEERLDRKTGKRKLTDKDAALIKSLVIYDDGDVIALNKPYDLSVQGGTKTRRHIDGMLDALKDKKGVRPRLVHRLDKDTSGVLLLARSAQAARALGEAFKYQKIRKIYWALVKGVPEIREGRINAPLMKGGGREKEKMLVDDDEGKSALTDYAVLDHAADQVAFMAFWPRTGRTHQIRVHALTLGCPILGDGKYGMGDARIEGMKLARRLHLHAQRLVFPHPVTRKMITVSAPLPDELKNSWKSLGFETNSKEDPFGQ